MKQDATSNTYYETTNLLLSEYYSRALAYLLIAATVATGCYLKHFNNNTLIWLIPFALLYPHFVKLLIEHFKDPAGTAQQQSFRFIDAALMGGFTALVGFSLIPSLLAALIVVFSALIHGGIKALLAGCLAFISTALALWFFLQPPLALQTPLLISTAAFAAAALYFCYMAYYVYFQGISLSKAKEQVKGEQAKAVHLAHSLAKYLSPQVWESIFSGKRGVKLEAQRKKLTVFFSDIKGFTELSEELEAEALTDVLNTYLNEMSKIALKYGGTIDKFIGDSVMIFFGDPSTHGAKKDALAAVSMAIEMRKHMKVLRQHWRTQGIDKPLEIRMGINTGYCTVGNFGAETRMDYTIIGREVNLASRLESAADANEILISTETYSLVKDVVMGRDKGQIQVKGFTRPVQIFQVVDYRRDLGETRSFVEHELSGFSMYMDTNNIQSYDKERIIEALNQAAEHLRDKII